MNRRHLKAIASIRQRFRHRYEVDPTYIDRLTEAGLVFSGRHPKHPIMQMLELPGNVHPFFIGAQFHPELTSRPLRPQPLFMGLLAASIARARPEARAEESIARWLPRPETGTTPGDGHRPGGAAAGGRSTRPIRAGS